LTAEAEEPRAFGSTLLVLAGLITLAHLGVGLWTRELAVFQLAAIDAAMIAVGLVALRLADTGGTAGAAQVVAYGLMAAALVVVVQLPALVPVSLLVPILAVVVALPHLRGAPLTILLTSAFACMLGVGAIGLVRGAGSPAVVASLMPVALVVLLLLRRFSDQLRFALRKALDTNAALRTSEERFRSLALATSQVVWTTDAQGLVVEPSDSWSAFTGQSPAEFKGTGWVNAVHPDDRDHAREAWQRAVAAGAPYEVEYRMKRPDGSYTPTVARGAPVRNPDGMIREWVGTNQDVTARVTADQELRLALKARDEFLSHASHELRTPLTSLGLHVHALKTLATPEDERVVRKVENVSRQVSRLGGLVESLLDISRISSGRLTLEVEQADLARVVHDVVAGLQPQISASHSEVTVEGPPTLVGHWDSLRLEQVVGNLLGNALKYGAGRPIALKFAAAGPVAELTVTDQGIGIAQAERERIFERFERGASSRSFGGLGLGLWIVRQITTAHGGEVLVNSQPGAGSTFTVRLPLAAADARAN
jgi:PAS domain S-box-containing protein